MLFPPFLRYQVNNHKQSFTIFKYVFNNFPNLFQLGERFPLNAAHDAEMLNCCWYSRRQKIAGYMPHWYQAYIVQKQKRVWILQTVEKPFSLLIRFSRLTREENTTLVICFNPTVPAHFISKWYFPISYRNSRSVLKLFHIYNRKSLHFTLKAEKKNSTQKRTKRKWNKKMVPTSNRIHTKEKRENKKVLAGNRKKQEKWEAEVQYINSKQTGTAYEQQNKRGMKQKAVQNTKARKEQKLCAEKKDGKGC